MAGTDTTLLALAGRGQQQRSSFGFMSCDRAVGASEGCNALQERKRWEGGLTLLREGEGFNVLLEHNRWEGECTPSGRGKVMGACCGYQRLHKLHPCCAVCRELRCAAVAGGKGVKSVLNSGLCLSSLALPQRRVALDKLH
eukprot:scaffold61594_cov22-Tisochrysis_lutea.AAC.3